MDGHLPQRGNSRNAETIEYPVSPSSSLEALLEEQIVTTADDDKSSKTVAELVNVKGYEVTKECEPLLNAIFLKYGDIVENSMFSEGSRSCLLELVCSIYKRLEYSDFTHLTDLELESLSSQVGDLDLVNVDIGWLKKRLSQICLARKLYEGVSTLEDVEARTLLVAEEKKKMVEKYEKELEVPLASRNELRERLSKEQEELAETLAVVDKIKLFYNNSLVHGLV